MSPYAKMNKNSTPKCDEDRLCIIIDPTLKIGTLSSKEEKMANVAKVAEIPT